MRVLVVNAGSSSLKLSVVDGEASVAARTVERWDGSPPDEVVWELLREAGPVDAAGHRVVHGGPDRTRAAVLDGPLADELDALSGLAPLHQPRALAGIRAVSAALPDLPAVACFDTAFHATIPPAASTYALPAEWNRQWRLRRYGFHGLSHAWAARRAAELVGRPLSGLRVVSCHLGAGASLCAIAGGRSVDTTMGFTPLEGLVMATRSGTVDPGLLLWLQRSRGVTADDLADTLERRSGLAGLSGTDGDIRDVLAARDSGDPASALAYDVYVHRLAREAAAMAAATGGLDLLVLTGGVGEHQPAVRRDVALRLAHLGVELDQHANDAARGDADISAPGSPTATVVVTAREDAQIAAETRAALRQEPLHAPPAAGTATTARETAAVAGPHGPCHT